VRSICLLYKGFFKIFDHEVFAFSFLDNFMAFGFKAAFHILASLSHTIPYVISYIVHINVVRPDSQDV